MNIIRLDVVDVARSGGCCLANAWSPLVSNQEFNLERSVDSDHLAILTNYGASIMSLKRQTSVMVLK